MSPIPARCLAERAAGLLLAMLLCSGAAAPSPEPPTATAVVKPPATPRPIHLEESVLLLAVPGKSFAGVLVEDGAYAVTLLELVRVGFPVRVALADGSQTRARVVAQEPESGLALLRLDTPAEPSLAVVPGPRAARLGEAVEIIGHGGTSRVPAWLPELGEMVSFSHLHAVVAAEGPSDEDGARFDGFLVDRAPGEGDMGAPIFDRDGVLLGLLADQVEEGGGRAFAVSGAAIERLLSEPRLEQPRPRQSHFQSWGGVGIAVHNTPLHFAGSALIGARIAIVDQVRLEPWFEVDLGVRDGVSDPQPRPRSFWWSLETGFNVGYRLNIFNPRSRDYVVPNAGVRVGWNRFDHQQSAVVADCGQRPCRWVTTQTLDRQESLRAGIDLGLDVQKGPIRVGYRFFIAPGNVEPWSMHRLFITFDGFPLPIRFGDSH